MDIHVLAPLHREVGNFKNFFNGVRFTSPIYLQLVVARFLIKAL